jgi:hypothetical protein
MSRNVQNSISRLYLICIQAFRKSGISVACRFIAVGTSSEIGKFFVKNLHIYNVNVLTTSLLLPTNNGLFKKLSVVTKGAINQLCTILQ